MTDDAYPRPPAPEVPAASRALATVLVVALAAASIFYRVVNDAGLGTTGALFIGLPTLVALVLVWVPPARSTQGTIAKGITLLLVLATITFIEGFVCVLFAAPIFYGIGAACGLAVNVWRDRRRERGGRLSMLIVGVLLVSSLEGTMPATTAPRHAVVAAERVLDASPAAVVAALGGLPDLHAPLPVPLRLGFPRPVSAEVEGLDVGDRTAVAFPRPDGPGALVLEVSGRTDRSVTWRPVSDTTPISGWLSWTSSEVAWEPLPDGRTRVRWTLTYDRGLDPVWYFGPLQSWASGEAAGWLIDAFATPASSRPPTGI